MQKALGRVLIRRSQFAAELLVSLEDGKCLGPPKRITIVTMILCSVTEQ